jgi:hypoxanthine phosphoribosyltransferase
MKRLLTCAVCLVTFLVRALENDVTRDRHISLPCSPVIFGPSTADSFCSHGGKGLCHLQRGKSSNLLCISRRAAKRVLSLAEPCTDGVLRQIHKLCQAAAPRILDEFKPNLMIAIGGGGYVPARILRYWSPALWEREIGAIFADTDCIIRSFLKRPGSANIPIQAIGLSLYESLSDQSPEEKPGTKVTRTQWLDLSAVQMDSLIGKNILIVDEVDDTRTTLEYAVRELEKDVEAARQRLGRKEKTRFSIFVLHNKDKEKKGHLPADMLDENKYLAAVTVPDVWICYPWEATDIDEHDQMAVTNGVK